LTGSGLRDDNPTVESRRTAALLVAAALLLAAACGSGSVVAAGGQPLSPQPFTHFAAPLPPSFIGLLTQPRHYNSHQIDLLPPPPSVQALMSPMDAFGTCWSEAPCVAHKSPEILLALYTNRGFGEMRADGSVFFPHQDVLAYVMTWRNVPFIAAGPRCPLDRRTSRTPTTSCSSTPTVAARCWRS
jgi:hypothetical protein